MPPSPSSRSRPSARVARCARLTTAYVALALPAAGLVVWFVGQERYVYFWDFLTYHALFARFGDALRAAPLQALWSVVRSIGRDEYNLLPVLPLSPFHLLLGDGRLVYILSVTLVFAVPAVVGFAALIDTLHRPAAAGRRAARVAAMLVPVVVLALLPQFWAPVLAGYPDAGGVAIAFVVLLLYLRGGSEVPAWRHAAAIGLLLCLMIVFRRWYAYWVTGFLTAAGMQALWQAAAAWRAGRPDPFGALKRVAVMGLTAVVAFFAVARGMALQMLTTDYADLYSAYRGGQTLQQLPAHFGWPVLLAAALGAVLGAADRRMRPAAVLLAVQLVVSYGLFSRVQAMSLQHFYLVLIGLAVLAALGVLRVLERLRGSVQRAAWLALVGALWLGGFASVLVPAAAPMLHEAGALLPGIRSYPMRRGDLDEVHRLLVTLKRLTDGSDARVYVLSSSYTLNGSLLTQACLAFEPALHELAPRILHTHDVDKRDGFPRQWLDAHYVVVTDPIGYHLAPRDQLVIGAPARALLDGEGVGAAFERLPQTFALDGGQTVYLYRKQRPFTTAELDALQDEFLYRYPDRPDRFRIGQAPMRPASDVRED